MKDIWLVIICSGMIGTAATIPAWKTRCDHIYTAVEQKEIKVQQWRPGPADYMIPDPPDTLITGKHEGQELVCVKCFHLTKQILDYGNTKIGNPPNMHPELGALVDSILKAKPPNTYNAGLSNSGKN